MRLGRVTCPKGSFAASEVDMVRHRLTVTVEEAGELLGISRAHAYELVRRGELPSLRLGRRIVVPVGRLRAMVDGEAPDRVAEVGEGGHDGSLRWPEAVLDGQ